MKLCNDCKHRRPDNNTCSKLPSDIDVVNGEQRYMPCDFVRRGIFLRDGQDHCGIEAKWFEPIVWWKKFIPFKK